MESKKAKNSHNGKIGQNSRAQVSSAESEKRFFSPRFFDSSLEILSFRSFKKLKNMIFYEMLEASTKLLLVFLFND